MKKTFAILTALLPAIYAVGLQISAASGAEDGALFTLLGMILLFGFLFPIWFAVLSAKADKKFLATCNLWFYGGNLLLLACEIALWIIRFHENKIAEMNGGMEGGLGLALLILLYLPHWSNYLVVRIVGAISTARTLKGVSGENTRMAHTFLQLIPAADLLSAIWVLRKVNAFQACQQPPIEMK